MKTFLKVLKAIGATALVFMVVICIVAGLGWLFYHHPLLTLCLLGLGVFAKVTYNFYNTFSD